MLAVEYFIISCTSLFHFEFIKCFPGLRESRLKIRSVYFVGVNVSPATKSALHVAGKRFANGILFRATFFASAETC